MCNDPGNNKKELITLNEKNLERVISWVSVIDSKAKFIFSVILVVLGYSISQIDFFIDTYTKLWEKGAFTLTVVSFLLMFGGFVCLIISFIYLVFIIYPKRKPYTGKDSYFFYESIAKMSASDFQAKMSSISLTETIEGLSDQTYNNAKVVKKKFDQLSASVIWFLIGLGILIIFSIIHQFISKIYLT